MTAYLSFLIEINHGTDRDGDSCIVLGKVHRPKTAIVWKGKDGGRVHKQVQSFAKKGFGHPVVNTVAPRGKTTEKSMVVILRETLTPFNFPKGKCLYVVDGAPSHIHAQICHTLRNLGWGMYISPPNSTPYAQACDKTQINGKFKKEVEEKYAEWLLATVEGMDTKKAIPSPDRHVIAKWVGEAFAKVSDDDIREACRHAYFPRGLKLKNLEDLGFFDVPMEK